jgi:hypothetical protein
MSIRTNPEFSRSFFILTILCFCSALHAQLDSLHHRTFNTKRNFVLVNYCVGGGDYPFAGLGLTLSRTFFQNNTMIGLGAHYIGNTISENSGDLDELQYFPIMVDIRQKFMQSWDDRFATYLIFDGGYTVSISGNDINQYGEYEYRNGWAINPGVSFRFNVLNNLGIMMDISWLHHWGPRQWLPPVDRRDIDHWDLALIRWSLFF